LSVGISRRLGGALAAFVVALSTGALLAPATGAAPDESSVAVGQARVTKSIVPGAIRKGAVQSGGVQVSGASGGRSQDMTLDGRPDITARNAYNGQLNVYPHSGTFNGLSTFPTVVTTSYGWFGINWIGLGYVTGDNAPDVLARTSDGRLLAYPHSGSYPTFPLVNAPVLLGYGWNVNDLIYLDDWEGDGDDDIIARRAGTNDLYVYPHNGVFNGLNTYTSVFLAVQGVYYDVWETMSDVTGDGVTDLIYATTDGLLGVFDFMVDSDPGTPGLEGQDYLLGYGWYINDVLVMNDATLDGHDDIVARRAGTGELFVYPHAGSWNPSNTLATFQAPTLLGYGWTVNDIIT
jgi:hypothetical protein